MRKVVDSVFKNHKLFYINIGTYGDILVQMYSIFINIQPLNLRSRVFGAHKAFSYKRWSPRGRPRGHILKSLASKPQVLKNCPVLSSRTALFFERLKFRWKTPETSRKNLRTPFLFSSLVA